MFEIPLISFGCASSKTHPFHFTTSVSIVKVIRKRQLQATQKILIISKNDIIEVNVKFKTPCSKLITYNFPAVLVWLAFLVLATGYSLVTPPFEAGDESRHYAVVKYMADRGRLPVQEPGEAQIHWSHEGNQPPLYYALAAALTFWIDTGDWDDIFWYNPHTTIGNPLRLDNKNITIHPPGEGWPWSGYALAVHLSRFLSIAMAAVTVGAAYAIALALFKGNRWPATGAMAITAFNPMFIFISASVNNDNGVIMFVTLALWLMVRLATSGYQSPLKAAVWLGLLIGLGALSKLYALGLLPLAGLLFLWLAYQNENKRPRRMGERPTLYTPRLWRNFLLWSGTALIVGLAVSGWFYVRNGLLYEGDLLALQVMRDTAGQRDEIPTLATLRAEFQGFRIAYWALFGGVNILADDWIYRVLDWASLTAALGVVAFIIRLTLYILSGQKQPIDQKNGAKNRPPPNSSPHSPLPISLPTLALLLAWYLIMMAGFILWNLTQPAGQGRLLYPAIAAISALGMLGLTWWLPPLGQKLVVTLCTLGLLAFASLSPLLYIAPAYARPPRLNQADLPPELQPVHFSYAGKMELIGYKLPAGTIRPAEELPLTLYWQLLEPVETDYSIFIHLLGRQRQVIGQRDTYPGGGKWPTSLLAPGDILADHYRIRVSPQAEFQHAPTQLLIAAGLYDLHEPGRPGLPATNAEGQAVEPIIARAKLAPWQWPDPPRLANPINFFDKVTLLSYQIAPDRQSITLNWEAHQPLETAYTVFIQAWRADTNRYAAGFDGPPVGGDYPTTLWGPGEIIVDTHPLDPASLAPGEYRLLVGLYDPASGERLPAFGPDGPLPEYAVNVGTLAVPARNSPVADDNPENEP